MTAQAPKAKDYATDQDIRWCPGCGDYSILKQVQSVFAKLELDKDQIAIISGIGCSSRFPYYTDTYGMHAIHGRAPTIATGLKIARPELSVWVVTGDGDGLSIGGNHLLHLLRRNVDLNVLLFNNQIYGLTKGQYSPTSEQDKHTKSSPFGSIDYPLNPLAFAAGSDATFIARSMDRDPAHLKEMIERSYHHTGTSLLEVYQNCNIFNDGAFLAFTDKGTRSANALYVQHGQPLQFGERGQLGIYLDGLTPKVGTLGEQGLSVSDLWIHDEADRTKAYLLTRFFDVPRSQSAKAMPRPFGVLYAEQRPTYEAMMLDQIQAAREQQPDLTLEAVIQGPSTWRVR